jgi:hypothetical protein
MRSFVIKLFALSAIFVVLSGLFEDIQAKSHQNDLKCTLVAEYDHPI